MRRRFKAVYLAPALALLALLAWALASPIGSSPDDDFHLTSIWCASSGEHCLPGDSSDTRIVPAAVVDADCFAQHATVSASCQSGIVWTGDPTVTTERGNFAGAYPPVYYSVMHAFVGGDVLESALLMRVINIVVFVCLTAALFALLERDRRRTLVWAWLVTSLPMGVFILASNNPSSWAVMGLGTSWLALLGFVESTGVRKWLLGTMFAVAALMAAGARGDAALYVVIGVAAVFVLTVPWSRAERTAIAVKRYALDAILPAIVSILCFVLFFTSRQTQSGVGGFSAQASPTGVDVGSVEGGLSGFGLFAYNLLNIPMLWAGNFGEWGLGWLDTPLPSVVSFAAVAALVAVGFSGLGRMWGRKLVVVIGVGVIAWMLPVYVLQQGGQAVGAAVQPRYLLPLLVLFVGLSLLGSRERPVWLSRPQLVLTAGALILVYFVALHFNMRRYLTGIGHPGANLNAQYDWWWNLPVSPMVVWLGGTAAYAALVVILVRQVGWLGRNETVDSILIAAELRGDTSVPVVASDGADDSIGDPGPLFGRADAPPVNEGLDTR